MGLFCIRNSGYYISQATIDTLLNNLIMFVAESSRGLVLPTLFLYVTTISQGNTLDAATVLGIVTSLFSIGRLIANLAFGHLLNYFSIRFVLVLSLIIHAIGQFLYIIAWYDKNMIILCCSRFIIGIGSSSLGINRSFITVMVPSSKRTSAFSLLSGSKFVGYALTPGLAVFFDVKYDLLPGVLIDKFTIPAILLFLLNITLIPLSIFGMSNTRILDDVPKNTELNTKVGNGLESQSLIELSSIPNHNTSLTDPLEMTISSSSLSLDSIVRNLSCSTENGESFTSFPDDFASSSPSTIISVHYEKPTGCNKDPQPDRNAITGLSGYQQRAYLLGTVIFLFLNIATKGALTLCEVSIASLFAMVYTGTMDNITTATSEYMFYLGLLGLLTYMFMVFKPSSKEDYKPNLSSVQIPPKQFIESVITDSTETHHHNPHNLSSNINNLCSIMSNCFYHCRIYAKEYDYFLLVLSQILSAVAMIFLSLPHITFTQLTTGFVLMWSIAGPIADVLTVSLYSVLLTTLDLRSKTASSMAWITAAGSLGRIVFPLFFLCADTSTVIFTGAIVSILCGLITIVYLGYVESTKYHNITHIMEAFPNCCKRRQDKSSQCTHELDNDENMMELPLLPTQMTINAC